MSQSPIFLLCFAVSISLAGCKSANKSEHQPAAKPAAPTGPVTREPGKPAPATCAADAYRHPSVPFCIGLPKELQPEELREPYVEEGWTIVNFEIDLGRNLQISYKADADASAETARLLEELQGIDDKMIVRPLANGAGTYVQLHSCDPDGAGCMATSESIIAGSQGVVRCSVHLSSRDEELLNLCASVVAL